MHCRYRIWCVRPRTRPGQEKDPRLLLVGLGYRRQIAARWRELTGSGDDKIPLQLWQALKWAKIDPLYISIDIYGEYETRADAHTILLNLRMGNKLLLVEDWLK